METLADRLVEEDGHHGRVHAAGKAQHHLVVPDLLAHPRDGVLHPRGELPVLPAAADAEHEVLQDVGAVLRVHHLGVELERVEAARVVEHRGERACGRDGPALERGGDRLHAVAVAHPYRDRAGDAVEERVSGLHLDRHLAVLALHARHHAPAELVAHELHAVADAEDGNAHLEERGVARGRALLEHAVRSAREDDAGRRIRRQLRRRRVASDDLRVHLLLADAPRDELRVLRAVVEDRDPLVASGQSLCFHGRIFYQIPPPRAIAGDSLGRPPPEK